MIREYNIRYIITTTITKYLEDRVVGTDTDNELTKQFVRSAVYRSLKV